jgi:hypothetical protein
MIAIALAGFAIDKGGATIFSNNNGVAIFSTRDASRIALHDKASTIKGLVWSPTGRFVAFSTRYKSLHLLAPLKRKPNERTRELKSSLTVAA